MLGDIALAEDLGPPPRRKTGRDDLPQPLFHNL
jgi:hypothetical protein